MKHIKKIRICILSVIILVLQSFSVIAAENPTLEFEGTETYDDEDSILISYNLYGNVEVTNGKMTITYDKNQLEFDEPVLYTEEDEIMADMKVALTSPKDGGTQEGELVFAFSGGTPVKINDCILDLYFTPKSPLKAGQKFDFNIVVDELTNNGTNVNVTVKQGSLTILSSNGEDDTEDESETETKKQTQQTKSTNSTTAPTETTAKGANAKTGDVTQILPWIGAAVLAILILGGLALSRKKDKKK